MKIGAATCGRYNRIFKYTFGNCDRLWLYTIRHAIQNSSSYCKQVDEWYSERKFYGQNIYWSIYLEQMLNYVYQAIQQRFSPLLREVDLNRKKIGFNILIWVSLA